jgi:hypothetical protein
MPYSLRCDHPSYMPWPDLIRPGRFPQGDFRLQHFCDVFTTHRDVGFLRHTQSPLYG